MRIGTRFRFLAVESELAYQMFQNWSGERRGSQKWQGFLNPSFIGTWQSKASQQ